jgi:pyruvate dehydrogenase E2 component (dihydrolipoyllysine-residue acetyltransferase)
LTTNILMPALSPTMTEGKLAKWHVKEGDAVKSGDVIAEIETDKATMEVEAVDEGTVAKILVPEGAEGVKVNAPIAVLAGEGEAADKPVPPAKEPPRAQAAAPEPAGKVEPMPAPAKAPPTTHVAASPLARRLAAEKGVALAAVEGTGPHGRIVKRDLEGAAPQKAAPATAPAAPAVARPAAPPAGPVKSAPPPATASVLPDPRIYFEKGEYEEVPHSLIRKAIARRLTASMETTPHYYLTVDCVIDELLKTRVRLNAQSPDKTGPFKLSVNDFVVRAAALALIKFPAVNVSWADDAMLMHKRADVGVAVAIEGGLITPIVRKAETKGLIEISREVASLAEKARTRKLKPMEYEGGSFAVSNLGMFGVKSFTAVINPPHAGILAVGKGEERAIVRDGQIVKANVMTITLSCDHRAVDGATGGRFLEILKSYIEDPAAMLL